jgi:hypothetical protein
MSRPAFPYRTSRSARRHSLLRQAPPVITQPLLTIEIGLHYLRIGPGMVVLKRRLYYLLRVASDE